jgi:hypothetical protein
MTPEELVEHVKLAINPAFGYWVLFKNGTYIIFDEADATTPLRAAAVAAMQEFGPVFAGGPAGDFEVFQLDESVGWVVAGHGYGMYTYVHPSEVSSADAEDLEVGLFGREKRDQDGKELEVLYISGKP